MGLLFDMTGFYRWLENASERELMTRRDAAKSAEPDITDPDLRKELGRLVRLIEEEMLARKLRV